VRGLRRVFEPVLLGDPANSTVWLTARCVDIRVVRVERTDVMRFAEICKALIVLVRESIEMYLSE
jgi:hypothetical protein